MKLADPVRTAMGMKERVIEKGLVARYCGTWGASGAQSPSSLMVLRATDT